MTKTRVRILALAVTLVIVSALCFGQSADAGITRAQADEILKELQQIRGLLEKQLAVAQANAQPAPTGPVFANLVIPDGEPMLGSKDAPLTIIEYTDYQCAFCQRFHVETYPELKKKYMDKGIVRFYSRDMPLDFHESAFQAAVAARCAGEQNQFWTLRNVMVANASKLSPAAISQHARALKMDMKSFASCIASKKYDKQVEAQTAEATKLGIDGTPTFVIGRSTATGVDGTLLVGAEPIAEFDAIVKRLLGQ